MLHSKNHEEKNGNGEIKGNLYGSSCEVVGQTL